MECDFLAKFQVNWISFDEIMKFSSFGPINKMNKPQILCSPLFPEGVDLRTNASGFQSFSLVPSNKPRLGYNAID